MTIEILSTKYEYDLLPGTIYLGWKCIIECHFVDKDSK
jgi:hypothetical protein